jgi:hypothetical protein
VRALDPPTQLLYTPGASGNIAHWRLWPPGGLLEIYAPSPSRPHNPDSVDG